MSRRSYLFTFAVFAGLLIFGLSSCGGSGDPTVATVGKTKVSRSTLNHWMNTMVGGDYQEISGEPAPAGLVSEPANYSRCVTAAKRIKPKSSSAPPLNEAQLQIRCRQLHTAVKEQALSYLISALWRSEEGAELGQSVSESELSRKVQELAYREYKSPAAFRRFLASRHWSIADERYLLRRNLLDAKFLQRLKQRAAALGGGEKAFGKLTSENIAKWRAKTSCSSGFTAWQCRKDGSTGEADPSAATLVKQITGDER